jgi:hypothetical protein
MNSLFFLLSVPGFIVGLLLCTRVGYLLMNIPGLEPVSETSDEAQDPIRQRRELRTVIIWCCSWLILFGVAAIYLSIYQVGSPGLFWFICGVAIATVIVVPPSLVAYLREKDQKVSDK